MTQDSSRVDQILLAIPALSAVRTVDEPYMGQEFISEAEAHAFYNAYATRVGFVIRAVTNKFTQTITTGQATLRLFLHDCFVELGGPSFTVELGRKDGLISKESNVEANLPKPTFNLNQLNRIFSKHNLTQTDMIALSGAHTIGFSHCDQFTDRLYSSQVDPTLNPSYAQELMTG
ncbi:hypothetical protein RYX36_028751, partial [Vicia faba]